MKLSVAGAIIILSLCGVLALATLSWPYYQQSRWDKLLQQRREAEPDRKREALVVAKQLGEAIDRYVSNHHGHLPSPTAWEDGLRQYLPAGFSFELPPVQGDLRPRRFAMNTALDGVNLLAVPSSEGQDRTVAFFESVAPGPSAADRLESLPKSDNVTGYTVVYTSGYYLYRPASDRDRIIEQADPFRGDRGWK